MNSLNVKITLREMAEVFAKGEFTFICYSVCKAYETEELPFIYMEVNKFSLDFREQWVEKVLGNPERAYGRSYGAFIREWNEGTFLSFAQFQVDQQIDSKFLPEYPYEWEYRTWMFAELIKSDLDVDSIVFEFNIKDCRDDF